MRPAMLDWITLVYLVCLATAPTAILLGILPYTSNLLLGLFPYGPLALALALIVLRTVLPSSRFDFNLGGGRWASIIVLLIVSGHGLFALTFVAKTSLFSEMPLQLGLGDTLVFLLPVLVCIILLYVMGYLFMGKQLGPRRAHDKL